MRRQHIFTKPQMHKPYTPPPHERQQFFQRPFGNPDKQESPPLKPSQPQPQPAPASAATDMPLVPLALNLIMGLVVFLSFLLFLVLLLTR